MSWVELWLGIYRLREKAKKKRRQRMAALVPQYPPTGYASGKDVLARARRNLPPGMRNRFGKDDT